MSTCPHGRTIGDNSEIEGLVMAAPSSTCQCCDQVFYFIDSVMIRSRPDGTITSSGTTTDRHACTPCGGRRRCWQDADREPRLELVPPTVQQRLAEARWRQQVRRESKGLPPLYERGTRPPRFMGEP